ncbi:ArnT family glycosyltransferase [Flaviaesturariibacter amylovorans]|uniref:Glycosyltransferase RgtA/B/C/D-like domain-containing protein n=1 Tax=Flaviaesturariibacter amylovorans TaxID=1084520 RepID=A0ABP8GEA1_9BACT
MHLYMETGTGASSAPAAVPAATGYARKAIILIAVLTLFRLFTAFSLELGNDESYYWMYSGQLKGNYFDHPPGVAFLIRLFTLNGLLQGAGWLRLGAVLCGAGAAWFLFRAVALLHSPRAGLYAAGLYSASFYAGVTAGVYIMPDSPQMLFWTGALWAIARIHQNERDWKSWLLFGAAAGCCIMSKVHGAFLWTGLGLYILVHRRHWLKLPQLYAAAAVTALFISPILFWNIRHDFITYRFHSRRVTVDHFEIRTWDFLRETVGQLLFNNPVNVVLIFLALRAWKRFGPGLRQVLPVFLWIAVPHIAFLLFVALFRDTTLPHWSGPAYVSLLPLAAVGLASGKRRRFLPRPLLGAVLLYLITVSAWIGVVHFYPGTYGSQERRQLGRGDISLDLYGWEEAGEQFRRRYAADAAAGLMPPGAPVLASYWWGAHVEYYFCRAAKIPFRGVGPIPDIREYHWRNAEKTDRADLSVAYCIMPADEQYQLPAGYPNVRHLYDIEVARGGKPAHIFQVYRLAQ